MDWNRDGGLIILFILLFVVAVVLAAAETALVRVSRVRIAAIAEDGGRRAGRTLRLLDDLPRVLNTILLVVLLVQIGAATVVGILSERWFGSLGVTIASFVLTVFLFVDGDSQEFPVNGSAQLVLERGEHQVYAELRDPRNRRITATEPVTFFVKQFSQNFNRPTASPGQGGPGR